MVALTRPNGTGRPEMRKSRHLLRGVAATALALRLAGCGSAATTTPTAPDPVPPPVSQPSPPGNTTATFVGIDTTTRGTWKGRYGALGVFLYPDGGTPGLPELFVRGAGTIQASGQAASFGGACTFDVRAPLRYSANNVGEPASCEGTIIGQNQPWPPNARFAAGLYNRTVDGVPFRIGVRLAQPTRVRLYLVDFNAGLFTSHRVERIDVYEESDLPVTEVGSIGQPYANGRLLDSRTFSSFENGIYPGWDVTGPVIFQFTAIEPNRYPDGSPIVDTNGLAVESGIFLDPSGTLPRAR